MPVEWLCDGCGTREEGFVGADGRWFKPRHWYARLDREHDVMLFACGRDCIDRVAEKKDVSSAVLPI